MKKTFTYLRTLLVGLMAVTATGTAWADGNKRILDAQNYESATASDWTSKNGSISLGTGDDTYGNYSKVNVSGSGNRTCAKTVNYAYEIGSGYTTAEMTTAGYVVEFDMQMSGGNVNARSISQFFLGNSNYSVADNATYEGTDFVFSLSQPQRDDNSRVTTWYINDLSNASGEVTINYSTWYHYKFVVSASAVEYTITHGDKQDATGSLDVAELPTIKGFYGLLGRGAGYIFFDNLEIYDYTEGISVSAPTFSFNKVDGVNRNYTITNPNGSGTLYYTTSASESAPEVGDAAYTSTTEASVDVDFSESGNFHAYVLHTDGSTTSPITTQAVTAGELVLTAPVFTVTDMKLAEDGFYYPVVTFASNNSALEGAPTATFDIASPYTFDAEGSVTVTASATGYTSNSSTFTVSNKYTLSQTIDFGALTASDFDESVWETATGAPRDYWTNRAAAIPADVTYYKLKSTSATAGEPDNSAVLDGITISNYNQRVPEVYIGYGLLTPYTAVSGSGNNMNFTVNGATSADYVVYNGWNNYGSGTFNTVLAGNATFGLYRYDTMLRTIKVYSPSTISATITSAGWATLYTGYALDFTDTGLTAYTATCDGTTVTLTEVTNVPAGTGVVLQGTEGNYTIPVIDSSTTDQGDLQGSTSKATTADGTQYILTMNGDNAQFAPAIASTTIAAGKAYLVVAGGASRLNVVIAGETTGITAIEAQEAQEGIYNLQGQRLAKAQRSAEGRLYPQGLKKGLYIVNGKKAIVK